MIPDNASSATPVQLRFIVFCESVVSDWLNPAATSTRALANELTRQGHDVQIYEERRNRPFRALLAGRGSSAVRAFVSAYPELQYRTYELPAGAERTVWIVRQLATADAVVVQSGVPDGVVDTISRLDVPRLVRVSWQTGMSDSPGEWADISLDSSSSRPTPPRLSFGPIVERAPTQADGPRTGVLIVDYGDADLALRAKQEFHADPASCISAGPRAIDGWTRSTEIELPGRYASSELVVVIPASTERVSFGRSLLPIASGCPACCLSEEPLNVPELPFTFVTGAGLSGAVTGSGKGRVASLPALFDASFAARDLAELVDSVLRSRRSR